MRGIAFVAEPHIPDDQYYYDELIVIWLTLAKAWGFDRVFCINASGVKFEKRRPGCSVYPDWETLIRRCPDTSYVVLFPDGGTPLDDYKEPDGDVIYVCGGDATPEYNFHFSSVMTVTVETGLDQKNRGVYSFCAMSVIARELWKRFK